MDALERVRELAAGGRCCTQVIVMMGMELTGEEDDLLVRAAGGLCGGMGAGGVCGCLTGGCLMLSLCGAPRTAAAELHEWFQNELCAPCGSLDCRDIKPCIPTGEMPTCPELMALTYVKAAELLEKNDLI